MTGTRHGADAGGPPPQESSRPPERAWVERLDGTTVELVLELDQGVDCWVATPPDGVSAVMVSAGDRLCTRQFPGQAVRFDRVWSAAGDPLVLDREDPQ